MAPISDDLTDSTWDLPPSQAVWVRCIGRVSGNFSASTASGWVQVVQSESPHELIIHTTTSGGALHMPVVTFPGPDQ
jgi:hypothetical protein